MRKETTVSKWNNFVPCEDQFSENPKSEIQYQTARMVISVGKVGPRNTGVSANPRLFSGRAASG